MSKKASETKSSASTAEKSAEQAAFQESQDMGKKMLQSAIQQNMSMFKGYSADPFNMGKTYMDALMSLWRNPVATMNAQTEFMRDSLRLWQYTAQRLAGDESSTDPVIEPQIGDIRWRSEDWSSNLVFDYIKQSYLLSARLIESTMDSAEGLDEKEQKRLSFFTKQLVDAMAPTNYPMTNPEVLKATLENKGENLVAGLKNFVRDLEQGDGKLKIAMTDPDAFTLGENVATTPGKVIFQNRMFQLIQYSPSTEKVNKRPLLIFPPWINKFYILDLQPKNSLIKWMVDQGHTVFVVSWVNPDDDSFADVGWETYLTEGIYEALDQVEKETAVSEINVVGYCIAGTLLASALAHMKAGGDGRIKSATFFTALIDFSEPGDLGVFVDDAQISMLEEGIEERGFHSGKSMSSAFNMLRSNDLIWSFYINNYLLGKDPTIFDLLYWNSDSTNMPGKMHSYYLRNMYLENKLCQPGALNIADVDIDVSTVDIPCYFISAHDDHIAPWVSTYAGARLFSGPVRFVLGGSGHIAGIVNPPAKNKYGYRVGPAKLPAHPDDWLKKAKEHEGSWWPDWDKWLKSKEKEQVDARPPGKVLGVLEDAPGSYVMKRI
ncbi:MAG: class I poly(R)-hydroxyalkanoic acid synthase [Pseudomonadales bacterium]